MTLPTSFEPDNEASPPGRADLRTGALALLLMVAIFHGPSLHNQFV